MIVKTWLAMNVIETVRSVPVVDRIATYRRAIVNAASDNAVRIVPVRTKDHRWRPDCAERLLPLI